MTDPDRIASLGRREKECLRLVYARRTTKEIAIELGLKPGTVFSYIAEAIEKLGADDRRQAAEWLHAAEVGPSGFGPNSAWVVDAGRIALTEWPERWRVWRRLLPIRQKGALHNDLSFIARATWPFLIAAVVATGFGMLAVGVDVLSAIYRRVTGQ